MDVNAILGALPSLGPTGVVLVILIVVGRLWLVSDRRSAAEIKRLNDAHDEELNELRNELKSVREEMKALREELEAEREARREAQEEAFRARLAIYKEPHEPA